LQLVDPHLTTPKSYTPPHSDDDAEQHRLRVLVDEVATTRGLTIQMSMRALAYHAAPDDTVRHAIRAEFEGMRSHFHHNLELVFGKSEMVDTDPNHLAILRSAAARDPGRAILMRQVGSSVDTMADLMAAGTAVSFGQANEFFGRNWPTARDTMTEIIWDVWAAMDGARATELGSATRASDALASRLKRLEHIGKHVRLVSLNASVEAARAGDVGKGLMVIAQEFKALAEEIQALAKNARDDMTAHS